MVVTPAKTIRCSIGVGDGRIVALTEKDVIGLDGSCEIIDAEGKMVLPGAIDVHVHLQDIGSDGTPTADDFYSGTKSAAWGGTTCVIDFVSPNPQEGLMAAFERRRREAEQGSIIDFSLHMSLTQEWRDQIDEIDKAIEAGMPSFKLFTVYSGLELKGGELFSVMKLIAAAQGMVMLHAEDSEIYGALSADLVGRGELGAKSHSLSRPDFVEEAAILRAISIAKAVGVPLHVAHVSSRLGVDAIRKYRCRNDGTGRFNLYGETCPHYYSFTEEKYSGLNGGLYIMSPPLRGSSDVLGIWEGLEDGTLDVVSTDHCPFPRANKEKDIPFYDAPNGIGSIGVLLYTVISRGRTQISGGSCHEDKMALANARPLSIHRIVELLSWRPASIFGLGHCKGLIAPGYDADLVVFDPSPEWEFNASDLPGNEDHSVFEGTTFKGRVDLTMSRGEVIQRDGEMSGRAGRGKFIPRFL
jgi:dihydropyrimidinase